MRGKERKDTGLFSWSSQSTGEDRSQIIIQRQAKASGSMRAYPRRQGDAELGRQAEVGVAGGAVRGAGEVKVRAGWWQRSQSPHTHVA